MRKLTNFRVSRELVPEKHRLLRQVTPKATKQIIESASDDEYSDPDISDTSDEEQEEIKTVPRPEDTPTERILKQAICEENELRISSARFLEVQKEMIPRHREVAVKWLIKLNYEFGYPSDTLHNAIVLFDLVTQSINIPRDEIQVYAIVCYFVSAKLDVGVMTKLTVERVNSKTGQNFTAQQFARTEIAILQACQFKVGYPTVKLFQRAYHDEIEDADPCLYELSTFFVEVALIKFEFMDFPSSLIALAAFILSGLCLESPTPTPMSRKVIDFYERDSLIACITKIRDHARSIIQTWSTSESSHIRELFQRIHLDIDIPTGITQYL